MINKILLLVIILVSSVFAQQQRILIDENYDDWKNKGELHNDKLGDANNGGIDFSELKIFNDENYLYLMINCGYEISLANKNDLTLYIDTDFNVKTGKLYNGMSYNLKYNFGDKKGWFYTASDSISLKHINIGLVTAPTVTSKKFEMAIDRNSVINNVKLFGGSKIKIALSNGTTGDKLPDSKGVEYTFKTQQFEALPAYSLKKDSKAHFRIVTYNIENDGFVKENKRKYFSRIINALDADIIAFQEFKSTKGNVVKSVIDKMTGKIWNVQKLGYDLVLATKFNIKAYDEIKTYKTENFTKLHSVFKLDLRPAYNSDIVIFNMHPKCCSGLLEDTKRQTEFDIVMAYLRDSKAGKTKIKISDRTPVFVLGDMNLVGSRLQQVTLLTGDIIDNSKYGKDFKPDWDGTALDDLKPFTTGRPMSYTNYNKFGSYSPGRLDYIAYTESVLKSLNSFVLFTPGLSNAELKNANLQKEDVVEASDHLPVVADFVIKKFVGIESNYKLPRSYKLYQNYPNPFNPRTKICYDIPEKGLVKLKIYDILGRKIKTVVNDYKLTGNYNCFVDFTNHPSGTYIYKLEVNDYCETKKMLYIK